jgi:Flp pilus assembly protein TadG
VTPRPNAQHATRNAQRSSGQSLVELALVAPILILLAMSAWDGGSVLREQIVLQQAARDGARVAATAYGPSGAAALVAAAVQSSAADLPSLSSSTPGYLTISYPDAQSVQVRLIYAHTLITPVLRQLWGGGQGSVMMHASATFYLPQLTPVPATLVPPTPTPTVTPSPTVTPTPSPTPTATVTPTPQPRTPCALGPTLQTIPPLAPNSGFWCTLQLATPSYLAAGWQDNNDPGNQLPMYFDNPDPFAGQPDPVAMAPPSGNVALPATHVSGVLWAFTPTCQPVGTYTVYFFDGGAQLTVATQAGVWLVPC